MLRAGAGADEVKVQVCDIEAAPASPNYRWVCSAPCSVSASFLRVGGTDPPALRPAYCQATFSGFSRSARRFSAEITKLNIQKKLELHKKIILFIFALYYLFSPAPLHFSFNKALYWVTVL